jgi:hypothetical protein
MAFLDNSGDIILDAVLTDEGRRRLALGDGSFRITKFALGDDEIDYSLYDKTPSSGSGYEDQRILQLPVFEAFTNNTTSLKNRLLTYTDNTLLYLPVVKLNNKFYPTVSTSTGPVGGYYVSVDSVTTEYINQVAEETAVTSLGYRYADDSAANIHTQMIYDQGIDSANLALGYLNNLASERNLLETGYLVEVDNRLLGLTTPEQEGQMATPSFIDDDSIATYMFALGNDGGNAYFAESAGGRGGTATPAFSLDDGINGRRINNSMIGPTSTTGRLGSRLIFGLRSSLNLQTTNTLFTQMGGTTSVEIVPGSGTSSPFSFINTVIRITGFSTGYRVEVPLKLLKYTS